MGVVVKIFTDLENYTSGYELKYNKFYVGLAKDGIAKKTSYLLSQRNHFRI